MPEWLLGVLGILPIYLAFHGDDDDDNKELHHGSQIINVLVTYLSVCAGCNLSIFLPVLASETLSEFVGTLIFIGGLSVIAVLIIKMIADIPVVSTQMEAHGEKLMKIFYVMIGLYVFWDSGLIRHILELIYSL
jgi:cadmium resistance protein CadD (predicted permease)